MTSLRKRLDIALSTIAVIREKLESCDRYPSCCLTFHNDNRVSCDILGPMPEEAFLMHCQKCRKSMEEILDRIYPFLDEDPIQNPKKREGVL